MTTRIRIQFVFTSGTNLYVILHDPVTNTVWNTDTEAWEAFNAGNWADYAIALTEQGASGYYSAAFPAAIGKVVTSEVVYQRVGGSPATSDSPAGPLLQSQGQNVQAIAGDADVVETLQQNLVAILRGAAAGVPTVSVIPTDLEITQSNALQGRSIVFTSGVAADCAGRIVSYNPTNGVVTLASPLAIAPEADDTFIIV